MLTTEQEVNIRKLATMIRGVKVAMLTTTGPDRTLHSRPMATQEADFDGTLWFFTQAGSEKTSEIRQNPQVNASYVSAEEHHYVSLTGHASVIQDREKMQELWSPAYRAWFPQGSGRSGTRALEGGCRAGRVLGHALVIDGESA